MAQTNVAVAALRGRVLSGSLAPGERLGETELAVELGMSRTPIREALRMLAAEGLVEITSNRGARVTQWSIEELRNVFEIRIRLEGYAARLAAERATTQQIENLEQIAGQIAHNSRPGPRKNLAEVSRLNSQFHNGLLDIAGSASLKVAVAGVIHASVLSRTQESFDDEAFARSNKHHFEIVAALRAGQGEWAESTMKSHLLSAWASLVGPSDKTTEDIPEG